MNQSKEACPYHNGVLVRSDHVMYFETNMCISGDDLRLPGEIKTLVEAKRTVRKTLQTKPTDTQPKILKP